MGSFSFYDGSVASSSATTVTNVECVLLGHGREGEPRLGGGGGLENRVCVWFGVACVCRYIYTDRGLQYISRRLSARSFGGECAYLHPPLQEKRMTTRQHV